MTHGQLVAVAAIRDVAPQIVAACPVALAAQREQHAQQEGQQEGQHAQQEGQQAAGTTAPATEGAGTEAAAAAFLKEGVITLWGYGIACPHNMVVCRQASEFLSCQAVPRRFWRPPRAVVSWQSAHRAVSPPLSQQPMRPSIPF